MAVYNTAYKSGTIGSFSGTTVTVVGFTPAAGDVGRILILNSGSGKLQHREITGVSGQDVTIAHAWNTNPFIDPSSNSRATDVNPSNGDTIVVSYDLADLIATDANLFLTDENHVLVGGTLEASGGAYIFAKNFHIEWDSNKIDIGRDGGMIFGYYGYVAGGDGYTKNACNIVDNLDSWGGNSIRKGTADFGLFDIYGGSYSSSQATGCFLRGYENAFEPTLGQVRMIDVVQNGNVGGRYDGNRSMLIITGVNGRTTVGIANPTSEVARVELSATDCDQAGYGNMSFAPAGAFVFPQLRDVALKVIRFSGASATVGIYTTIAKKEEIDLIPVLAEVGNPSPNTTLRYGNLLTPTFIDSAGAALSGTLVTRLYDATATSVNNEDVTGGAYTEFFARHTDISLATTGNKNLSDGTLYAPYTLRGIQYGKQFGLTNISVEDAFNSAIVYLDDTVITEATQATVDAYTELETPQKFYDRAVSWLESNITDEQAFLVSRSGELINAGSYDIEVDATASSVFAFNGSKITIKATEFVGNITTTGTITLLNGAKIIGNATDSGGTVTTLLYSITGLIAGSNVRVYNVTAGSEFFVRIIAGTSTSGTYTEGVEISAGDVVDINTVNTNGTTAYYEKTVTVIASSSGLTGLVNQDLNAIYNDNNIDGSTVTGISLDVPNVEFDLDESDDTISSQEIYAWYMNELMTTDGIRTIYKSITPKSQYRYCIDPSVVDLKLDNKDLVNSLAITNGYFYSLDNTSVIASGSGNIEMIPNESYVANSAEIVSGLSAIESKVDIVDTNVDEILLDTDELQQNQGDWLTATGFSTFDPSTDPIANVTLVDTCTTNTDQRGTDGANTVAPDNAGITQIQTDISNLNDPTVQEIVNGVWDEPLTGATHNDPTSAGRRLRQASVWLSAEGELVGTPTTTVLGTNLAQATSSFYADQTIVLTSGTQEGQARIILSYNGTTKEITVDEPFTSAPIATDEFAIFANHVHTITQIQNGLATEANATANKNEIITEVDANETKIDTIQSSIESLNDFDPVTDVVTTDAASRDASKADLSDVGTRDNQSIINENVKKSSKLIPASGNLPDS